MSTVVGLSFPNVLNVITFVMKTNICATDDGAFA